MQEKVKYATYCVIMQKYAKQIQKFYAKIKKFYTFLYVLRSKLLNLKFMQI